MIVNPAKRADWFTWSDPSLEWCQANAEIPGLRFGTGARGMIVDFHLSHIPCMPDEVQTLCQQERHGCSPSPAVLWRTRRRASAVLRSYQLADYLRLQHTQGALLAYEMRLGKTPLACHLHDPATGILVIAAPLAAREAWRIWVEKTLGVPPLLLAGRTGVEFQSGYPAYFCHYDVLEAHSGFFLTQKIGTLVVDECHILQARGTHRLSAVNSIAPRAAKVLALSGTPMWNKPKSLWTLLHLIAPGAWGTQFEFRCRYANAQPGAHGWTYEGASHEEELQARLATIIVRRTWTEVAPELPPTTMVIEPVELSAAKLTKLEAAAMKCVLARGTSTMAGYLATLRRKMASAKIAPAVEIARQAAADGHKVVLWTWHNEVADKLYVKLNDACNVFRLSSDMPAALREREVEQFRAASGPTFLVAAMGVGGVGLDLSCSDYAIFVELDWTPAVVYQASMRTFHVSRPHVLVFLHSDDPIETKLVEALDVKNGFAASVGLGADEIVERVIR